MMGDECLNASKRRKIEDTVLQILKSSDLETTTELSVRSAAAGRLGFELSGLSHRRLVRQLVDSFLLSTAAEVLRTTLLQRINDGSNTGGESSDARVESEANCRGKVICKLSDKRGIAIHDMNGTTMVEIGDININDGNMLSERGENSRISLTATEWTSLTNNIPSIQEAILKLESQSRSVAAAKSSATEKNQTEAVVSKVRKVVFPPIKRKQPATVTSEPTSKYQKQVPASRNDAESNIPSLVPNKNLIPAERKQTEADISTSAPSVPSQGHGHLHYTANSVRPERLIPIQTTRFNGKFYHSWRHQMELFLNQLNIAYVLFELCPSSYTNPDASSGEKDKVKSKIQRWNDDDYLCRHSILNSLSDDLFQLYSRKNYSARELWEELKSEYDDDFGTTRSQINKYIHFQMVEGVPILKQAEELLRMANSIMDSGIFIEESFHVSVIVSKLPPSWKEFRARLMQEDFLPVNVFMHRLRLEEESRNIYKRHANIRKDQAKFDPGLGRRKYENRRVCVCFSCGKEGHHAKNCPDKLSEDRDKNCRKENEVTDKVDAEISAATLQQQQGGGDSGSAAAARRVSSLNFQFSTMSSRSRRGSPALGRGRRGTSVPPHTSTPPTAESPTPSVASLTPMLGSQPSHFPQGPASPFAPGTSPGASTSTQAGGSSQHNKVQVTIETNCLIPSNTISHSIYAIIARLVEEGAGAWQEVSQERRELYLEEFQKYYWWDEAITHHVRKLFFKRCALRYGALMYNFRQYWEAHHTIPKGVTETVWLSLQSYWARPEVQARFAQNALNRMSEPAGRGTGMARHRGGSRCAVEYARAQRREMGSTDEWAIFNKFHPVQDDGSSTYGGSSQLHEKVKQKQQDCSQDALDDAEPTPQPNMSQLYLEAVEPKKGRILGLGNLSKTKKFCAGSSSSSYISITSQQVDHATLQRMLGEQMTKMQEQMETNLRNQREEMERKFQSQIADVIKTGNEFPSLRPTQLGFSSTSTGQPCTWRER